MKPSRCLHITRLNRRHYYTILKKRENPKPYAHCSTASWSSSLSSTWFGSILSLLNSQHTRHDDLDASLAMTLKTPCNPRRRVDVGNFRCYWFVERYNRTRQRNSNNSTLNPSFPFVIRLTLITIMNLVNFMILILIWSSEREISDLRIIVRTRLTRDPWSLFEYNAQQVAKKYYIALNDTMTVYCIHDDIVCFYSSSS